jgi:PAN domain
MVFALSLAGLVGPAAAQDGTARLGADYDIFVIGGSDPAPCAAACGEDPRCKAWTFIKTLGQCRLKHTAVSSMANACCASGPKPATVRPARGEELTCADFAVDAIGQNDLNVANQCGYRGPLWSASYGEAFGRCLEVSPKRRQSERDERAVALTECQVVADRGEALTCDHYARLAVEEMTTNKKYRCGLKGAAWSDLASEHTTACRQVARTELAATTLQREAGLRACLGRGETASAESESAKACSIYVRTSLAQVVRAQQLRCGRAFAGPAWSPDDAQHYAFCKARAPRDRDTQLRDRTAALDKCEQDRKRFRFILKF